METAEFYLCLTKPLGSGGNSIGIFYDSRYGANAVNFSTWREFSDVDDGIANLVDDLHSGKKGPFHTNANNARLRFVSNDEARGTNQDGKIGITPFYGLNTETFGKFMRALTEKSPLR